MTDRIKAELKKLKENIARLTLANDKLEKQIVVTREADRRVKERRKDDV